LKELVRLMLTRRIIFFGSGAHLPPPFLLFIEEELYDSDSDDEDELDPVEGEDTVGARAQGDKIYEVISVSNSESKLLHQYINTEELIK